MDFHYAIFYFAMDFLSFLYNIPSYGVCTMKLSQFLHFKGIVVSTHHFIKAVHQLASETINKFHII